MKRRQREKSRPNTRAETRTETRSENHRSEKNEPKPTNPFGTPSTTTGLITVLISHPYKNKF